MDHSVVSTEARADRPGHQGDLATQRTADGDFRVQRAGDRLWEILALSDRAVRWLRANCDPGSPLAEDIIRADLIGTNGFMGKARAQGYRIEYVGPHSVNVF
ncbi:hypothetical protein EPK84_11065 (plasmid) [Sinorhizobium fredii]|nr:hypothetical protein EPK84_11065 [Sinorhizobium fredii]